jgi:hypothetical protein
MSASWVANAADMSSGERSHSDALPSMSLKRNVAVVLVDTGAARDALGSGSHMTGIGAVLLELVERFSRTLRPPGRQVQAFLSFFVTRFTWSTLIKNHHDVRTECGLYFH